MVAVFLICWSPYASLAVATLLGYAQVGRFTGECHGTIFYHLTASTHSKKFNKIKDKFGPKMGKTAFLLGDLEKKKFRVSLHFLACKFVLVSLHF